MQYMAKKRPIHAMITLTEYHNKTLVICRNRKVAAVSFALYQGFNQGQQLFCLWCKLNSKAKSSCE